MNLFKTTVSRSEEIEFDNKRLVYVNDIVQGFNTHDYQLENILSTDQVISLFDGGYRVGVLEQLDFVKNQSKVVEERLLVLTEEFKRFNYEQNIDTQKGNELISEIEIIFKEYQSKIESNLVKKFDVCQYSNDERVRDERVKERGEEFVGQLLSSFRNLS